MYAINSTEFGAVNWRTFAWRSSSPVQQLFGPIEPLLAPTAISSASTPPSAQRARVNGGYSASYAVERAKSAVKSPVP
jgi:hypothetical protein